MIGIWLIGLILFSGYPKPLNSQPEGVRKCAVPLLNVLPRKPIHDPMPRFHPAPIDPMPIIIPIPACNQ